VPNFRHRDAGVEKERPAGARPGLGELLSRQHAQREAGVDEFPRQRLRRSHAVLDDRVEPAHVLDVCEAVVDRAEGAPVEEIGRVDGVAGVVQLVRERVETRGLALCVMEEQHVCHLASLSRVLPRLPTTVPLRSRPGLGGPAQTPGVAKGLAPAISSLGPTRTEAV
jgi:hypothetical protein